MPRSLVHGRCVVCLATALAVVAVGPACVLADPPPKAGHARSTILHAGWRALSAALEQVGTGYLELCGALAGSAILPPPPAEPARSMLVRVVDRSGAPVVGAIVTPVRVIRNAEDFDELSVAENELGWNRTLTGMDGTVRIARPVASEDGIRIDVVSGPTQVRCRLP